MERYLAYLRALLCRDGVEAMRRDAAVAWDGLSPRSPYRATMLYTEGLSYLLEGDLDRADPILARAFDTATDVGALPLAAIVLAHRCSVAVGRDDWPTAMTLAEQALSILQDGEFDHYWTSALVYAWAVRAAIHRGDAAAAREHIIRAARLRPLLTYALPEAGEARNARSDGQRRRADTRTNQGIPSSSLWVTTRAWGRLS